MIRSPLITIVVPTYNAEKWIVETLESVLIQTCSHEDLELVVVDDGSEDSTIAVIEERLNREAIKWQIKTISNSGPSYARNIGWRTGQGKWIQFLDADDLLHPDKLAIQSASVDQTSANTAAIYSPWQHLQYVDEKWEGQMPFREPSVDNDPIAYFLTDIGFIHTGAQLFNREWLQKVGGFDERYWLIEDVDLMLRLAMADGQYVKVPYGEPLFFYRRHTKDSLSQRDLTAFIDGCVRNAELAKTYWDDHNMVTTVRQEILINIYLQAARYYADTDTIRFDQIVQKIEAIQPNFIPSAPNHLRQLSRLIGYRNAEKVATKYRQFKTILP